MAPFLFDAASAVTGAVIVCGASYVCYRYGEAMARLLGSSGTAVVLRLSACIMRCIGMPIMVNGAVTLFHLTAAAPPAGAAAAP